MAYENYSQNKSLYDSVAQVFQNYREGTVSSGGWNKPLEELKNVTMKLVGENHLELTYHFYEVTTIEGIERMKRDNPAKNFLDEVVKALKKEFKKVTGKNMILKKTQDKDLYFEKVSRLTGESSWMLGSSRYGHGARPVGTYLCRVGGVFEFNADL